MSIILLIIAIGLIIAICIPEQKPVCYNPDKAKGACSGDACAFKYHCKLYKNYIEDE